MKQLETLADRLQQAAAERPARFQAFRKTQEKTFARQHVKIVNALVERLPEIDPHRSVARLTHGVACLFRALPYAGVVAELVPATT